jgi:tetratricopeptide (TPR) repeat protein
MAKSNKQRTSAPIPAQSATKTHIASTESKSLTKDSKWKTWLFAIFIGVFSFLIYSNTFKHRFVLDDHGIIKNNKMTKAPISWENTKLIFSTPLRKGDVSDLENSLYRPAVKMLFNIEWNLFGGNENAITAANKFHVVNVLLYAILCGFIFMVLYHAMQRKWLIPFLIALLFASHPIHVESVANVKSADEVLSLLGIIMALRCIQLYIQKDKLYWLILALASFALGSFSKESTLVAVAIFPLFIYFFTQANTRKNVIISCVMLAISALFLLCRSQSLAGYPPSKGTSALDNYMVLCKPEEQAVLKPELQEKYSGSSQFASAVNTLGLYVKTFFIPHPLSCDYSYSSLEPVRLNHFGFLISFIFFVAIFIFAVYRIKKKDPISFGILWFFFSISIVSNVFFLIGTSFGERLFFIPSLGLCIALIAGIAHLVKYQFEEKGVLGTFIKSPIMSALVLLIVILFSIKTYARNKDWETDFNLFSRDIKYFPKSTHLLFYLGNHLAGSERKEILTNQLTNLGYNQQQIIDTTAKENLLAIKYFNDALDAYPALPSDGYNQLGKAYYAINNLDSAFKYYMKAHSEDTTNAIFINNIGTVYYNRNQVNEALPFFVKANKLDSTEADFANNIGCIYGATNKLDTAIYWFDKASKLDPLDITSLGFLEITYRNMGRIQDADYYKSRLSAVKLERMNLNQ